MVGSWSTLSHSKFRTIFWPIHRHELGKFLPMCVLLFSTLFNQNILRILKDSILISEISAEVVSFTKVYCVTPSAALFVIIYAKMINHLNFEKIYYYLISTFILFFVIFAFVIYPNVDVFHMDKDSLEAKMAAYPHFKWYIALVGHWGYVMFYTLSELWPNIFYVLLFWQFANEFTTTEEAKRYYTLFSLFGNSALIVVGFLMMNLSSENTIAKYFFIEPNNKIMLVKISTSLVLLSAIISCFMVRFVSKNVLTNPTFYADAKSPRPIKDRMGLIESFRYITKSKYLWLMLICSAAFGFAMNLVEAVWKAKIKELYTTVNTYAEFNSLYILWTGVAIMVMTIVGNNVMRSYSWFVAAVMTPIIMMVTGILFFILIVFDREVFSLFDSVILMTPLALAVLIGAVQNILVKGTKYSIWDTSREMLYIPLDKELKTKGKAAVDVISSKVGKSSSGLIYSVIFTLIPTATFSSISPLVMIIFTGVCIMWIYSVRKIYFEYKKIV